MATQATTTLTEVLFSKLILASSPVGQSIKLDVWPVGEDGPTRRYNPPFEPAVMAAKLERLLALLDDGA